MSETHRIAAEGITVEIAAEGAELQSVRDAAGAELLWQAGEEWPRRAPVLFPIVGRLANDTLHAKGRGYRLTQHGFARDSRFEWTERADRRAVLRLEGGEAAGAAFPYPFRFEQIYAVAGSTLTVTSRVTNPGDEVLPCGVGAHPGFAWPLAEGVPKDSHVLVFDRPETGPVLSVEGGLLAAPKPSTPFEGDRLPLREELFAKDALVLPDVQSRSVRFAALRRDGGEVKAITLAWDGYKDLGIWSKPSGAPFLCIEPWFSMASQVGWDGDFAEKPGILHVPPGESREFVWRVTV
ncbi:aldose 1-epimerase family protein [Aureimonas leprariae]|uniref:Aldose 1-epimerase family protein n=1 Tax=Plantimonas leprariae TaxID=2615207 RepID=A0A7V7TY33_9HYPH|nr:aldose 1-epimerase family protein [Aureimonas leprariae]KAB0682547.1 aldose 1-epimerase family protein [Aureimonas leprariae]